MRNKLVTIAVSLALAAAPLVALADLININTADLAALETLNGIGPSKGQAIIDYRTQHGAFATIADIQNVSGIGPTTYANIKDYITVGTSQSTATTTQTDTQTQSQSQTQTQSQSQTTSTNNGNLPPALSAHITGPTDALAGAGTVYDGQAYDSTGKPLATGVRYIWNFGDGARSEDKRVLHTYQYPGTYALELGVAYDYSSTLVRQTVVVTAAAVSLVAEGDGSLTIYNHAPSDMDVGLWSLADQGKMFTIPEDTLIVAGGGVRFATAVTGLAGSRNATLSYPNGNQAAAAGVAPASPLRGQQISAAPKPSGPMITAAKAPAAEPVAVVHSVNTAAAADAPAVQAGLPTWVIFAALGAILGIGAVGAYYAQMGAKPKPETSSAADEFEIEE